MSSRPVGYPAGLLRRLKFSECELLDFDKAQISEFAGHWCTAIRLARNETHAEARREGTKDGAQIVAGFDGHPYIKSLARNPLMLSAICLVNYFEGGHLPNDRAVLYRLCVEGLLHNWDQRRGILSDFTFDEKLRAVREVALRMQVDDRAEYDSSKVRAVFAEVLQDDKRAAGLLEYIRYRTGLLLERRPGVFAFAHLVFQEYLAARAIYEGNRVGVGIQDLISEHGDARWQEVIALYCGISPAPVARATIEALVSKPAGARLLEETYFSSGTEVTQDQNLRDNVIQEIALGEFLLFDINLRFTDEEFSRVANRLLGQRSDQALSFARLWLLNRHELFDGDQARRRIGEQQERYGRVAVELVLLVHYIGSDSLVGEVAKIPGLYHLVAGGAYGTQARVAFQGLLLRPVRGSKDGAETQVGADKAWIKVLIAMLDSPEPAPDKFGFHTSRAAGRPSVAAWPECRRLIERLVERHPSLSAIH